MKDRTYTLNNLTRDDLVILSDAMEVYLDDLNTALHFEEDAQEREASLTWVRGAEAVRRKLAPLMQQMYEDTKPET